MGGGHGIDRSVGDVASRLAAVRNAERRAAAAALEESAQPEPTVIQAQLAAPTPFETQVFELTAFERQMSAPTPFEAQVSGPTLFETQVSSPTFVSPESLFWKPLIGPPAPIENSDGPLYGPRVSETTGVATEPTVWPPLQIFNRSFTTIQNTHHAGTPLLIAQQTNGTEPFIGPPLPVTVETLPAVVNEANDLRVELHRLDGQLSVLGDNHPDIDGVANDRHAVAARLAQLQSETEELQPTLDTPADRYFAAGILAPESILPQLNPVTSGAGIQSSANQAVLPVGAKVTYGLTGPNELHANPPEIRAFVINDPEAVARGEVDAVLDLGETYEVDLRAAAVGTHTIVFERRDDNGQVRYYTWNQEVTTPEALAQDGLESLQGTPPQPDLLILGLEEQLRAARAYKDTLNPILNSSDLEATEDAIDELEELVDTLPDVLNEDAVAAPIPLRAVLVADDNGVMVPLQLYARPMADGQWAIVDITDPSNPRTYTGRDDVSSIEGLDNAWSEFIDENNLPGGHIAAEPPGAAPNYDDPTVFDELGTDLEGLDWADDSDGQSGFEQWRDGLGIGSLVLTGLGVGALVLAPFTGGTTAAAAPWLFAGAGITGAGSAYFNIADRREFGEFRWWSSDTALDLLGIAGGFTGGFSSFSTIARTGTVTRTVNGARVTVTQADELGKWLRITTHVDEVAGVAGGVLVTREYMLQIEAVQNDDSLSASEKQERTESLTLQAMAHGGLMILGLGAGTRSIRRTANASPEMRTLDNLANGLDGASIDNLIRQHGGDGVRWAGTSLTGPDAALLLDGLSPTALRNLQDVPASEALVTRTRLQRLAPESFDSLASQYSGSQLAVIADVIVDSNTDLRMSPVNANALVTEFAPEGAVLREVAGPGGAGSDLVFDLPDGTEFRVEHKSLTSNEKYASRITYAVDSQGADVVFLQVREGTDVERWLGRFWGNRQNYTDQQLAHYASTEIEIRDTAGKVLLERQPIWNPP